MKPHFYPPSAEDFILVRRVACLTQENASEMLHVTLKTIQNWEKGRVAIPYSAFKLLKVLSHYELPMDGWQGWSMGNGRIYSPKGRSFLPYELSHIGNYFQMARYWLAEKEVERQIRRQPKAPVLTLVPKVVSNDAAALTA